MPTIDALLRGAQVTDQKRTRITKTQRVCGRHRVVCVRPNVRVKLGPAARRQAQAGENVPSTARLGLAPCRWASAWTRG